MVFTVLGGVGGTAIGDVGVEVVSAELKGESTEIGDDFGCDDAPR